MDPSRRLSRARVAVLAAFLAQGLVFISLTTRLPQFSDEWDLSEVQLSGVLLMMVLLAGAGSLLAESVARRRDSARVLRAGLLLAALAVPVLAAAPGVGVFVGGLATYGLALGLVDAGTNMQAVAVEHRHGRPLLPSFHGAWTLGGLLGAGLTLATSGLPLPATGVLAVVPLAVALLAPFWPRDHGGSATAPDLSTPVSPGRPAVVAAPPVPWHPILLVGLAMVLFYMVDTAATTWGPLYLDDVLATPERLVALATFPYLLASGLVRLAGDRLVAEHGPVRVLRAGALVAAVGLVLVVAAPTWPVAVAGFTVLGGGVAVIAPLSFSAAARIAGDQGDPATRQDRVDAVIARFNQFNYVGALLGSVLTGLVGSGTLRVGFAVPMVLVVALVPLARVFAPTAPTGTTVAPG